MRYRHSLRFRIIVSFLALGGLLSPLLAGLLFASVYLLEEQLVEQHVAEELEHFMAQVRGNPAMPDLESSRMSAWRRPPGELPPRARFLDSLPPGFHELEHAGRDYYAGIALEDGLRYTVLYDITDFERRERTLVVILVGATLGAIYLSVWFGYSLSRRLIAPVSSLAGRVAALRPDRTAGRLAADYPDDEVGDLARAFDAYNARIREFMRREREFTADASHELRNPLAVIQSACELLLSREDLDAGQRARLERIDRAARDMSRRLAALLLLAREQRAGEAERESTDLAAVVERTVEAERAARGRSGVALELQLQARPRVAAPSSLVEILVANLARNAFSYTAAGRVRVRLEPQRLVVEDTGAGIHAGDLEQVFERGFRGRDAVGGGNGLGLSIAKRICDRHGWALNIHSRAGEGTRVEWVFGPS